MIRDREPKEHAMWPYLLLPLLAAAGNPSEAMLEELAQSCQTGTLIFSQGDCLAIKVFSKSRFTHCGAVVWEDGRPVAYDSMNGTGVRKTPLAEYLKLQAPSEIQLMHPGQPFTEADAQSFRQHLHSELGREYGVKHHLTGQRAKGIHCAEYCTDALIAAGKITAEQPARVSPGSLHDGLMVHQLYTDGGTFPLRLDAVAAAPPADESWCRWAWRETCECTTGCCRQMSRWFLCREK